MDTHTPEKNGERRHMLYNSLYIKLFQTWVARLPGYGKLLKRSNIGGGIIKIFQHQMTLQSLVSVTCHIIIT